MNFAKADTKREQFQNYVTRRSRNAYERKVQHSMETQTQTSQRLYSKSETCTEYSSDILVLYNYVFTLYIFAFLQILLPDGVTYFHVWCRIFCQHFQGMPQKMVSASILFLARSLKEGAKFFCLFFFKLSQVREKKTTWQVQRKVKMLEE